MDLPFWTSSWVLRRSLFRARVSPSWVLRDWPPCCVIKTSTRPHALPPPCSTFNTEPKPWGLAPCDKSSSLSIHLWLFLENCKPCLSTQTGHQWQTKRTILTKSILVDQWVYWAYLQECWWPKELHHRDVSPQCNWKHSKTAKIKYLLQLTFPPIARPETRCIWPVQFFEVPDMIT